MTSENCHLQTQTGPRQMAVTPPPPPQIDLSDDDLLVIRAALTGSQTCSDKPSPVAHSVTDRVMSFEDFLATTPPDGSGRNRQSRRITLNLRCRVEYELSCWLDTLKQGREYRRVIVDALRLFRDLRSGRYEVLKELFPQVFDRIIADHRTVAYDEFAALLYSLHEQQQARASAAPAAPSGPALAAAPAIDDTPLPVRKAASDGKSAANFLAAAFALLNT